MKPRRQRTWSLLRLLAKFLAVVIIAGGLGTALGIGLSKVTSRGEAAEVKAAPTTTAAPTPRTTAAAAPRDGLRVRVISAVLHPATTASGVRRRRARLGVSVLVENLGDEAVAVARPSLLAARQRIPTNSLADGAGTHLEPIGAGKTVRVTLRFETAGRVTDQLRKRKRARILVGRRSLPITVNLGSPVRSVSRSDSAAA